MTKSGCSDIWPRGQAAGWTGWPSPSGAEQEGEAGVWLNLKQDVLLLDRLLAPELGASETTRAGPWMDLDDSDPGWEVVGLPRPRGQAGREARPAKIEQDQPKQRVPLRDCGPAKCQGPRGAHGTRQTTLASEGSR